MSTKKYYLNGEEITDKLKEIMIVDFSKIGSKSTISLVYKNGGIYKLGEDDDFQWKEMFPKFKIGDYVVEKSHYNTQRVDEFIKIYSVRFFDGEFQYNINHLTPKGSYNYLPEHYLRKPTEEELKKYFR